MPSRGNKIFRGPAGVEANADFAAIRARVQKMADIGPAFESTAIRATQGARRRKQTQHGDGARQLVMAAIITAPRMALRRIRREACVALHRKKRDCYAIRAPGRPQIEAVSIPFKEKRFRLVHLPPGTRDGKLPVIIRSGHGLFKETSVALANDRWMARGVACWRSTGRQYESPLLASMCRCRTGSMPAVVVDWLLNARRSIRKDRVTGTSFGSFFGTIVRRTSRASPRPRRVHLPSSPLPHHLRGGVADFKKRFMWMSDFTTRTSSTPSSRTLTWEGHVEKIRSPIWWWRARPTSSARSSTPSA